MHALEQFRILFKGTPVGLVAVAGDGCVRLVNPRAESMFGYSGKELVGQPVENLVPDRFRSRHFMFRSGFASGPQARPMGAGRDLFGQRKDGSEFPVEIALNPVGTSTDALVLVTVVDITERKRAEEQLAAAEAERDELRRHLMQAQEQERSRLARELHDRTGQTLTAAMLELKGIEMQVEPKDRERLRELRRRLEQIETTISRVAWELRPASIDDLGLASALSNYVSEWSRQFGIDVDFHCRVAYIDMMADDVRTTVYRVAQEALTNVAKHARGASAVSVIIDRDASVLHLTIEDDGCGFNTDETAACRVSARGGHGIAGMRERLLLVGGALEVESSARQGTTVFARIPLVRAGLAA
jgi:PAS domain S-box-containing protein